MKKSMQEHVVVVTWYGGQRGTGEQNRYGFGVLVTTEPGGNETWVGHDVYISAEHLEPLPAPGSALIGSIVETKKGLALRGDKVQALEALLHEQPERMAEIMSRVLHIDTYTKLSSSIGNDVLILNDEQIVGMLSAPERRSARIRTADRFDRDSGALDSIRHEHLKYLYENASIGLRLTHPAFAGFAQAQDVLRIRECMPPERASYDLSDVWSRALSSRGESHSEARKEIFKWRSSHPGRSESANPLKGLLDVDIDEQIVGEAQQLPLRFRASHSSWPRLISGGELNRIVMPGLLAIDTRKKPELDEVPFGNEQNEWPEWLHELLTGQAVQIEHGGDRIQFASVKDKTLLKMLNAQMVRSLSSQCVSPDGMQDAWIWFLLHPNTVGLRALYPEVEEAWDPVLRARLQITSNEVLLGRALELHWESEVNIIESLLSRTDDAWIDSASQEAKTRLVYFLVSQDRRARLQSIGDYLDGAAGVLAKFAIAEWSAQQNGESWGTGKLIEELERVAAECLLKGRSITEYFTAIAPACLDRASACVAFCEAKLQSPSKHKGEEEDPKVWCGRARNYRLPRESSGTVRLGRWNTKCAAGPLSSVGSVNGWTVAEFLDALKIAVYPAYVIGPMDLAVRFGAWINRLLEVEERLRCRTCRELMTQDFEFAKFDAVYRSTVLNCRHGEGHDQDVYLTHCWNCSREKLAGLTFVDGRDCAIRFEHRDYPKATNYLLCIECGAGPDSKATGDPELTEYELIGRLCPKCGDTVGRWKGETRNRSCPKCNHQIRLTNKHWKWISEEVDKRKTRIWTGEASPPGFDGPFPDEPPRFDGFSLTEPSRFDDQPPVGEPPPWVVSKERKR